MNSARPRLIKARGNRFELKQIALSTVSLQHEAFYSQ